MTSFRENASYLALMTGMILGAASPTYAVDGLLEINQACAVNTGCFTGDTAGFPISLTVSGSYVLTGPLDSGGTTAIQVLAPNVTLDLNGFAVTGSADQGITLCGDLSDVSRRYNIVLRNGSVRGFRRWGVSCNCGRMKNFVLKSLQVADISGLLSDTAGIFCWASPLAVRNSVVSGGSGRGIWVVDGAVVQGNVVTGAGGVGLEAGDSAFGDNLFADNNGGNANPQTSGGISSGGNVCGTTLGCP